MGDAKGLLGLIMLIFYAAFQPLLVPCKESESLATGQNGNTSLVWHNGKLLALMETGVPFLVRLCAGAVKSISDFTFGGALQHGFTAHPKVDPRTGEMCSFAWRYVCYVPDIPTAVVNFFVSVLLLVDLCLCI